MIDDERLARFREALASAARAAFSEVKKNHPEEHLYAFALYTEPCLGYVVPTCNSEEGLPGRLDEVQRRHPWHMASEESFRWNPCDWIHHDEGADHFAEAQRLLDELHEGEEIEDVRGLAGPPGSASARLFIAFVGALEDLDREGFFGSGAARDEIVVNVLWGDQHIATHLETAERLNPKTPFLRYAKDSIDALRSNAEDFQEPRMFHLLARLEKELDA